MKTALIPLILSCMFPIQVLSQTNDLTNVRNAGAFTCSNVIPLLSTMGNENEKTAFLQWTAGFSTAASRANSLTDVFPITDTWNMMQMVILVCRENEDATYEDALRESIKRLKEYWVIDQTELIDLNDPTGERLNMYRSAILPLQKNLQALGYTISIDGVFGNQTGNAIRDINSRTGIGTLMIPDGQFWYVLTRP